MDLHALGSLVYDQRDGFGSSFKRLHTLGGQWLPKRGHEMVKLVSSPFHLHYASGRGFKTRDWKKEKPGRGKGWQVEYVKNFWGARLFF